MTIAEMMRPAGIAAAVITNVATIIVLGGWCTSLGQEPSTASPSSLPAVSPQPVASQSPPRTARISFVPPPMEGTISLGVFDSNRNLVRVLDREAKIDNFTLDENSLTTTWDGKNDAGADLPSGKYHARGYMVDRHLNVSDFGEVAQSPPNTADHIAVKLVTNPLVSDTRSVADIAVGFDPNGSFLRTIDGLPLRTISRNSNVSRVSITKRSDTVAEVWEESGSKIERFELMNIQAMMAFDCGDFELK
jgi:hypothetical protein